MSESLTLCCATCLTGLGCCTICVCPSVSECSDLLIRCVVATATCYVCVPSDLCTCCCLSIMCYLIVSECIDCCLLRLATSASHYVVALCCASRLYSLCLCCVVVVARCGNFHCISRELCVTYCTVNYVVVASCCSAACGNVVLNSNVTLGVRSFSCSSTYVTILIASIVVGVLCCSCVSTSITCSVTCIIKCVCYFISLSATLVANFLMSCLTHNESERVIAARACCVIGCSKDCCTCGELICEACLCTKIDSVVISAGRFNIVYSGNVPRRTMENVTCSCSVICVGVNEGSVKNLGYVCRISLSIKLSNKCCAVYLDLVVHRSANAVSICNVRLNVACNSIGAGVACRHTIHSNAILSLRLDIAGVEVNEHLLVADSCCIGMNSIREINEFGIIREIGYCAISLICGLDISLESVEAILERIPVVCGKSCEIILRQTAENDVILVFTDLSIELRSLRNCVSKEEVLHCTLCNVVHTCARCIYEEVVSFINAVGLGVCRVTCCTCVRLCTVSRDSSLCYYSSCCCRSYSMLSNNLVATNYT